MKTKDKKQVWASCCSACNAHLNQYQATKKNDWGELVALCYTCEGIVSDLVNGNAESPYVSGCPDSDFEHLGGTSSKKGYYSDWND